MHRLLRLLTAFSLLALALGATAIAPGPAGALQYNVTNGNNSGSGSLREALADAESNPGSDTVVVQAGVGTINLSSPIVWAGGGAVTIDGNGVTIDANGEVAALIDDSGDSLTVEDLNITGVGGTSTFLDSAPIISEGGPVIARDCTISGNDANTTDRNAAGAIVSQGGDVTVDNCEFTDNTATSPSDTAGAVFSAGGAITLTDCTITGNQADGGDEAAGGALAEGGAVSVDSCDVSANTATGGDGDGDAVVGGILSQSGPTVIANSAINDNRALGDTAELAIGGSAAFYSTLTVRNSTVSGNAATVDYWVAVGGLTSLDGVSVSGSTIQCNTADNSAVPEEGEAFSVGGVFGEGDTFALNGDTFIGNTATGNDVIEGHYLYEAPGPPTISDTTFSDDTSVCEEPTPTPTTTLAPTTTTVQSPTAVPAAAQPAFTG